MKRSFNLGTILSVTTGVLVSPDGMAGVQELCEYMTGDAVFTHQLLRVAPVCKAELLRQLPGLADINAEDVTSENWQGWLAEQVARCGDSLYVRPLSAGSVEQIDPVSELRALAPHAKFIAIVTDPENRS